MRRIFSVNLREIRKKHGLSQRELDARAGLCPNTVGYLERGARDAHLSQVARIARALAIPAAQLVADLPAEGDETP